MIEIDPMAKIECDEFVCGEGTIIRANAEIYGTKVTLGRDSFIDEYAVIGGGSAGELTTGDWFHLGMFAQINTARPVTIGEEVGIGVGSRVFTHGAYLSELDGYPVNFKSVVIGDRVWLPNAIVMPGVNIGSDAVVAAGSIVTNDIPDHTLSAGTPAKVIRRGWPKAPSIADRVKMLEQIIADSGVPAWVVVHGISVFVNCNRTQFSIGRKTVVGECTPESERLRNELRRHGIRFRVFPRGDSYQKWPE